MSWYSHENGILDGGFWKELLRKILVWLIVELPCKMIAPVIEELAEEFEGRAKICKVNTDEQQDISIQYGIRSIPTILFFKNGEIVDQTIGAQSKQVLADKLNSLL